LAPGSSDAPGSGDPADSSETALPRSLARSHGGLDPAPLSLAQVRALGRGAWRELSWGLVAVNREVNRWRARARAIPSAAIRRDALSAIDHKRGHIDGAGMFATLADQRNLNLLRLLVAYEVMWDFLDTANEHGAGAGEANGRQLHLALIDALDAGRPIGDYYRHHPWKDDGGYLKSLVQACRVRAAELPSYERVRPLLLEEAARAQVLALNHELDPERRDAALRAWAADVAPAYRDASWFELSGAGSASVTAHALFALAAKPRLCAADLAETRRAYFPWIAAATTLLDSYVDQAEDTISGDHSYVAHYRTPEIAARRVGWFLERGLLEARTLQDGERHVLLVACMAAMYLSKDSARTGAHTQTTRTLVRAGGSLTRLLLPILRVWRIAYAQRSS
jgi:tetraprenyl-beta-curcumene synthase